MPKKSPAEDTERPLISNATILILSGFLIGLTVGKFVAEDLSPYVLACGLSGFLAFIALELAAERRANEANRREQQSIARRLERHVVQQPSESFDAEAFFSAGRELAADSKLLCDSPN
jgi:hypothetical protein